MGDLSPGRCPRLSHFAPSALGKEKTFGRPRPSHSAPLAMEKKKPLDAPGHNIRRLWRWEREKPIDALGHDIGGFGAGQGKRFWPHSHTRLFLRRFILTYPLCADVLTPGAPARRQIGDFINAWIAFNYIFQSDKPTLI